MQVPSGIPFHCAHTHPSLTAGSGPRALDVIDEDRRDDSKFSLHIVMQPNTDGTSEVFPYLTRKGGGPGDVMGC